MRKRPLRLLRMYYMQNKVKIIIIFLALLLVSLSIWGLMSLESFYRNMTLGTMPVQLLAGAVNAIMFVFLYTMVLRGGFTKLGQKKVKGHLVNVRFSDVIGIDEAKEEAWEVVQLVKDHSKVKKIGGKIVKGILMMGPPGCGKTYLAKAIATEAGLPFLSMAASEFNEVFVGVGSSRVRQLFKQARALAYGYGGCVIFIDELDVIGKNRVFNQFGGGEANSTQNQLLAEMDGIASIGDNVIVIGATNASEDALDPALLRPGRFDRKVYITKPGLEGREKLFRYYLDKVKHDSSINCAVLARKAVGKSPAEIEAIIKESALIATRNKKEYVSYKEISEAIERVELGMKVKRKMSDREKKLTAYHEAGHLITLFVLHPTDDVFKASIIPRRSSLGVVHHQPREEYFCNDKSKILADIKVALSGYVAEKIVFGVTTDGVASDFKAAMYRAHAMVWDHGMGDSGLIGSFSVIPEDELSDAFKEKLNSDTNKILRDCLKEAEDLLTDKREILDRFANELIEKEELEYDEIESIFSEYGISNPRKDKEYMPEEGDNGEKAEQDKENNDTDA